MMLLMGPPGCGKTATLHALAKDMNFSILEWVNPITDAGGPAREGEKCLTNPAVPTLGATASQEVY